MKLLFKLHQCSKVCFSDRDELTQLLAQDLLERVPLNGIGKEFVKQPDFQKEEERGEDDIKLISEADLECAT